MVKDVRARQQGDDILVEFRLDGEPGAACDYTAYLNLDGGYQNGKVLERGEAVTGEAVRLRCPAEEVSTYPAWVVTIYAESKTNGFTDFHAASSEPFAFSNRLAPGPVRELSATVLAEGVRVEWKPPEGVDPVEYLVAAQDAAEKVLKSLTVPGEAEEATLPLEGGEPVSVWVAARSDQGFGQAATVTVEPGKSLEELVGLVLPDRPQVASGCVELAYDTNGMVVPIRVWTDGERRELTLSGTGVLRILVHGGTNRISVAARGPDGVWVEQSRRWLVDLRPPTLRVFEDWDGLATKAKAVLLAGWVDEAAVVTINGAQVPVRADGVFTQTVELAPGENLLLVSAQDQIGNRTTYEARVVRERTAGGFWWWVWLGVSVVLTGGGLGLLLATALRRRARLLKTFVSALVVVVGLAGVVVGVVMLSGPRPDGGSQPDTRLTAGEKQAFVQLLAGDLPAAYRSANARGLGEAGRPPAWLIAARSALLQGDIPAAGFYYERLQAFSIEELEEWGLQEAAAEIAAWEQVAAKKGPERREAAKALGDRVQSNLTQLEQEAKKGDEELAEAIADGLLLNQLQEEVELLGSTGSAPEVATLLKQLQELAGHPGAAEARSLYIHLLVKRGEWRPLVRWLASEEGEGLVELAELVASGVLPVDSLSGMSGTPVGATPVQLLEHLAKSLEETAGSPGHGPARLYLALLHLYASPHLDDFDRILQIVEAGVGLGSPVTPDELAAFKQLSSLQALLEAVDKDQSEAVLRDWLVGSGDTSSAGSTSGATGATTSSSTTATLAETEGLPEGLSGDRVRDDLIPYYNICAPEMSERNRLRFFVTMAEGSDGFPGGRPQATDFAFRTDVGFKRLLSVNSFSQVPEVERYTVLLIDQRPLMSGSALALAQAAALAYVRSMPEGEKVLVYRGGLPPGYRLSYPEDKVELFSNPEMESFLLSSDKAQLEQFITTPFAGDVFDNPDLEHMVSWALNQMSAISPQGVSGAWDSYVLSRATPRFGHVIVFTNGDPGAGVMAGGDKGLEYVRAGAIAANAVVHVVAVEPVVPLADLAALAEAGRGSLIDPRTDDLYSFYQFVRDREVTVFLADCAFPEYPVDQFFQLMAQHLPTGVIAGFLRNPGKGPDLVGTLHYSDANLSEADFSDFTGGETDGTSGGGNPFEGGGEGQDGSQGGGGGTQGGGEGTDGTVTDWPSEDGLRVDGLDRHAIARGGGGLLLVNLLGQGFSAFTPSEVRITLPGLGTIATAYLDIQNDTTIRFFLPVNMPSGMYSVQVTVRGRTYSFPDTL